MPFTWALAMLKQNEPNQIQDGVFITEQVLEPEYLECIDIND